MTLLRYHPVTLPTAGHPFDHAALESARDAVQASWRDGTYGFLGCPDADAGPYLAWADGVRATAMFDHQIVIGVGGSSLGARAVLASWTEDAHQIETLFSENMDPVSFRRLFDTLDLTRVLIVVVTKSGTTIETMSKFWIAWERMQRAVGESAHKHFVAITDPERGTLRTMAEQFGLTTFEVPPNVGGRFSVLTAVGLAPLALAGYPVDRLLAGARAARDHALTAPFGSNAALAAALDHANLHADGHDVTVMMAYSDLLGPLAEWFCQLWGESLGKARTRSGQKRPIGLTPVRAVGVVDQHSQLQLWAEGPNDKHVVFVEVRNHGADTIVPDGLPDSLKHLSGKSLAQILTAELQGTRAALQDAGRPQSTWELDAITPESVGAFLVMWEVITALVGELWNIDAFDQPGVELGKKIAHGLLGRDGFHEFAAMADTGASKAAVDVS